MQTRAITMVKRKHDDGDYVAACVLSEISGNSNRKTARITGLSHQEVPRIVKRARTRGWSPSDGALSTKQVHPDHGGGWSQKKKPTERAEVLLKENLQEDGWLRNLNWESLAGELQSREPEVFNRLSLSTIKNAGYNQGCHRWRCQRKTVLSDENKRKRLKWCKAREHWGPAEWKLLISSDEAKGSKGQQWLP
jgi:hypothetical protein